MSAPSNPDDVLRDLQQQAERKTRLKMFYSAADMYREYNGPFAQETATERTRLAEEFENRGRAAEQARWGTGTGPTAPMPPTKPVDQAPPPPLPPPKPRPVVPAKPKGETPKPAPATSDAPKPKSPPRGAVPIVDGKLTFPCRWCNESMKVDAVHSGKLLPCPKCDLLVKVPEGKA